MYKVSINLNATIAGCPESGIEACEFRAKHGIPEQPTNRVTIKLDVADEGVAKSICQAHRKYLDQDADLNIFSSSYNRLATPFTARIEPTRRVTVNHGAFSSELPKMTFAYDTARNSPHSYSLTPDLVSKFVTQSGSFPPAAQQFDAVAMLISELEKADGSDLAAAELQIEEWKKKDEVEAEEYANRAIEKQEKINAEQRKLEADKVLLFDLVSSTDFGTEANPLETIRLKREEGYHWVNDALEEYKKHVIRCLGVSEVIEEDEDDCVKVEDLKHPSRDEILYVRRIRELLRLNLPARLKGTAELNRVTYQRDEELWTRNEVYVTVDMFGQWELKFYLNCPC